MNRTTMKVLSLTVSAVMAFSVGFSAFAEQATPETAIAVEAAEVQTLNSVATQSAEQDYAADTVAVFKVGYRVNGVDEYIQEIPCTTLQAAFDEAKAYIDAHCEEMWDEVAKTEGKYIVNDIVLEQDCKESVAVSQMKIPVTLQLNGHTLTAAGEEAIRMKADSHLTIWDASSAQTGKIDGGDKPIFCVEKDAENMSLYISNGIYDSTYGFIHHEAGYYMGNVSITGGTFPHATPDKTLIADGYELVYRDGVTLVQKTPEGVATVSGDQDGTWTQTPCATLQEAFNLATQMSGFAMIQLTTDVMESVTLDHVKDVSIYLDLNGYHITGGNQPTLHLGSDFDNGFLVIQDEYNGQGGITGNNAPAIMVDRCLQNKNSLQVTGGIYRTYVAPGATLSAPVVANYGKICLIRGTFIGAAGQPVVENHSYKYETTSTGVVQLTGAILRADKDGYLFKNVNEEEDAAGGFALSTSTTPDGSDVVMGEYYGKLGDENALADALYVESGKFENKVDDKFISSGSTQTKEDGMYVVRYIGDVVAAGDLTFKSFQGAINGGLAQGEPFTLLRDMQENIFIDNEHSVELDLNGHTWSQAEDGQLNAFVVNNGTLTITGDGKLVGTLAMYDENAVTYLQSRDLLQGKLADGVSFMQQNAENGYAVIRAYNVDAAAKLTNALDQAEKAVQNFYGSEQKLTTLTDTQLGRAAWMTAAQKKQVNDARETLKNLDKDALERILSTEKFAELNDSCSMLEKLYEAANKEVKTETAGKEVESKVDASTAELPKTEEKIPADKQPTKEDAENAVQTIVNDVTGNTTVNSFKDNKLAGAVDMAKLPGAVSSDDTFTFSVQVEFKSVELDMQVEKDAKGNVTKVTLPSKTLVYNVEPMVSVNNGTPAKLENNQLNGSAITVRLPIPKDVTEKYAKVAHEGDADRYLPILTAENGDKYIEFTVTHFSDFTVNFTNTLPAANNNSASSTATPAPTQAPAQKNDGKDIYYTCTACGYHDWTATDEGYKCNHCGHIESVKQLSGYSNVKGVYEPKTSTAAAAAQKASVKSAAIPQTSDDMPIAAITVVAVAALLGFGITAARKFHH